MTLEITKVTDTSLAAFSIRMYQRPHRLYEKSNKTKIQKKPKMYANIHDEADSLRGDYISNLAIDSGLPRRFSTVHSWD